ncbi:ABC transporter permease [Psychromonas sp. KJ10-10]|uniref:ABC transporter permease n=1 Tax=Psychromonas sp. KJ10-10 TaxID=3391823 RepID=UPI0039B56A83
MPISSIIAVSCFEFLVKIFVVLIIGIICLFMRIEIHIDNVIVLIFIFFQVWLFATCIGIIFAIVSCYLPEIEKLRSLAMRPIFFISGIFFSLQDIPIEYWHYLNWNPLLHAVELMRYVAYPSYGDAGVSEFYLNMFTLCSLFLALAIYHISWKQAISR